MRSAKAVISSVLLGVSFLATNALVFSAPVQAQEQAQRRATSDAFEVFQPRPSNSRATINYDVWTQALRSSVFYMGPSLRRREKRPPPATGSRVVSGHTSAFRLEGNRVRFSAMDEEFVTAISNYREDLELTGNEIPLTSFSRNEQLAYWINLHNVTLIEQVALNYPVVRPAEIAIGKERAPLQDAKLLTINGVPISLRDIREKIVYRYWNNPKVIYGFFQGNIGGPSIQGDAFTGGNVGLLLNRGAKDYINSLRGVEQRGGRLYVSELYFEAREIFFPNWPTDLKNHLLDYAKPEVQADLDFSLPLRPQRYNQVVADLAGGSTARRPISQVQVTGADGTSVELGLQQSRQVSRMLREFRRKMFLLQKKNGSRGTVTIVDVETEDKDAPEEEEKEVE